MKRQTEDSFFSMRISGKLKKRLLKAAKKAGFPSLAEFLRVAAIEKAEQYGIKIDRYE